MSHLFYEGEIYHKRFVPKLHDFTYPFFLLDIDMEKFKSLNLNFFSFKAKDHFGSTSNFEANVQELLQEFDIDKPPYMRFLTLPRMFNFVFNPISILVLFNYEKQPTQMLVEVHNYNGGRIVYPVILKHEEGTKYTGSVFKDMYVSPFLKRDGLYKFRVDYSQEKLNISITLYEENQKTLIAVLKTKSQELTQQSMRDVFFRHIFLTFRVVTRTLWQSLKLYIKGIGFNKVTPQDQVRRY